MAQYLGVPKTANFRVVAVSHGADADLRDQTRQVARVLASRQRVEHIVMEADDCLYVAFYVPVPSPDLRAAVRGFGFEIVAADDRLYVGAGSTATRLADAPKSRADAEKVVAYLRRTSGERLGSVNTLRTQMTLMRLVEILDSQFEPLPGSLQGLNNLESADRDEAVRTLDAYFSHPGNASEAARQLLVHPNTFRYRLAKVADMLGIDLDDRDTRLLVEIDLLRHRYGSDTSRA
jgi:sugar diacid utilization regulator